MPKNSLDSGRIQQKLRTRQALMQTARHLLAQQGDFTMEEVARAAEVSRATLYRYFSDADMLKLEAHLDAFTQDTKTALQGLEAATASERAQKIQRYFFDLSHNHESTFRAFLSVLLKRTATSPGADTQWRGARRILLLEEALTPLRNQISAATFRKLVHALAVMVGIESYIVIKDVCRLQADEGLDVLQWAMVMMIRGALLDRE